MDRINSLREVSLRLDKLIGLYYEQRARQIQEDEDVRHIGDIPFKVMHLKNNPIDKEIHERAKSINSLRKENERLRAKLSLLEQGGGSGAPNYTQDSSNGSEQIEFLTHQVNQLREKEEKILNSFKKTSREFREVCYLLTGYRIDPLKDAIFRLSHMYAEHEEDRLYFEVKHDGTILLLKNEYTDQYNQFITTYLEEADSFPAFLAAITLDLFKAQTHNIG